METPFWSMNSLGSGFDVIVDEGVVGEVTVGETTPGLAQDVKDTNRIKMDVFNSILYFKAFRFPIANLA
jgi:hypothetical protein